MVWHPHSAIPSPDLGLVWLLYMQSVIFCDRFFGQIPYIDHWIVSFQDTILSVLLLADVGHNCSTGY